MRIEASLDHTNGAIIKISIQANTQDKIIEVKKLISEVLNKKYFTSNFSNLHWKAENASD